MNRAAPLSPQIVIAHRGASGERPEHTLAAYRLAIEQGADVIEPDLVITRDGVLVARHENEIGGTTDVASRAEFADRRTTKTVDGTATTGWFTEDFTLVELKRLRARERIPQMRLGNAAFDGQFEVPTFAEIVALAKTESGRTGRTIGVYPETKHPTYFARIGLPLEAPLVAALDDAGWHDADAPVFVQSFEVDNLRRLHHVTGVRLIQLVDACGGPADETVGSYAAMVTPDGLREIARYAWGIGPNKVMVCDDAGVASSLVRDAHAAGLRVHPWTFRAENGFLPPDLQVAGDAAVHGDLEAEIARHLALGVDGVFCDFPAMAVRARTRAATGG